MQLQQRLTTLAVVFAVAVLDDVATNGSVARPGGGVGGAVSGEADRQAGHSSTHYNTTAVETSRPPSSTSSLHHHLDDLRVKRSSPSGQHRTRHGHGQESGSEDLCDHATNKQLCLPKSYSKFELPITDFPNVVEIGIDISDVLSINDKEYSVTFSCYFNVLWQEPRLHISEGFLKELNESDAASSSETLIPVNLELVNELWLPNIFIYNLKTFKVVEVLSKHAGLWVTKNHDVFYSQATHITFICPMRFDSFPLDTQRCKFQVGSYSFDDTKMIFLESPRVKGYVETSRSIVLDYDVTINQLSDQDRLLIFGSLGNYSVAGFEMILHRYVSHYIITYYLPSGLFVVVSWISFVVPPDVIPGRMALLITLFLVLVNIFNSVTTNTPKAEGLTAIEAWMLACILFVFGALVEYAAILFRRQTTHYIPAPQPSMMSDSARRMRLLLNSSHYQDGHLMHHHHHHHHLQGQTHHHGIVMDRGSAEGPPPPPTQSQGQVLQTTASNHYHLHHPHAQPHMQLHHPPPPPPPATATLLPPHHPHYSHQRLLQHHLAGATLIGSHEELELDEKVGQHHQGIAPPTSLTSSAAVTPEGEGSCCPTVTCRRKTSAEMSDATAANDAAAADDVGNVDTEINDILYAANATAKGGPAAGKKRTELSEAESWVGENYIRVDRFFLIAMPLLFLVFNVVYWFSYGSHFILRKTDQDVG